MLTAIKIQPNMSCEYICQHIQNALSKYQKENNDMDDVLIVIDFKKTIINDNFIPKLEHKISQP